MAQADQTARTIEAGTLTIRSAREGDEQVVAVYGELDISCGDALDREMQRVEAGDATRIVVDLSGLEFMDSTGIRTLLSLHARSRADGDRLLLLRGAPAVQQVLEITGADRLLPFAD
ncbi:MAG: anti-sigma factor antagonist [Solirubrobacteraceae bacterium]|jgi:anti-sigma B factor antagonist|nr:anti-sigma factor antagonist [Solirubrobacteraceae bacterium]